VVHEALQHAPTLREPITDMAHCPSLSICNAHCQPNRTPLRLSWLTATPSLKLVSDWDKIDFSKTGHGSHMHVRMQFARERLATGDGSSFSASWPAYAREIGVVRHSIAECQVYLTALPVHLRNRSYADPRESRV
jgi:hypothetical protein